MLIKVNYKFPFQKQITFEKKTSRMRTGTFDYTKLDEYMQKNGFTILRAGVYQRGQVEFDLSAIDALTEEKIVSAIIRISFETGLKLGEERLQGKMKKLLGIS